MNQDWKLVKSGLIPVIKKVRRCPECNKILSKYNPNQHCFNHITKKILKDDLKEQERKRQQYLYYKNKVKNEKNQRV